MSMNSNDQNEEPDVEEKPAVLLSTAQLILRRGLTTLAALLILAVGIAVHLIVPLPEVSNGAGANFTLDSNFTTATPSQWVSFETWTSDRFTVNISMLWTWEVMKKLYWIRKVEAFSHWSQAVYCDLDRWSYFNSVCTCFAHSIRLSSKKIEQLSRKRSVPQWHSHIISPVDISSQAAGEMLPKRRHSIKPLSYIEKSVLLNMVEWWKLEANIEPS